METLITAVTDGQCQFANEEVESGYTYPREYKGPKPIEDQIMEIAKIFGLDPSQAIKFAKNLPVLPEGAEGWFAIPEWRALAPTYGEAVEKVLVIIASKRKFYDQRGDEIESRYLQQLAKTTKMFQKISDEQNPPVGGGILVVPAQFGLLHSGQSVRRAREVFAENEFGLGSFAIGVMLLTHPEREVQWEQLHVDCAGDEFFPGAIDIFSLAPIFVFDGGEVKLSYGWCSNVRGDYGSASAFLPQ